MSPGRKNNLDS